MQLAWQLDSGRRSKTCASTGVRIKNGTPRWMQTPAPNSTRVGRKRSPAPSIGSKTNFVDSLELWGGALRLRPIFFARLEKTMSSKNKKSKTKQKEELNWDELRKPWIKKKTGFIVITIVSIALAILT